MGRESEEGVLPNFGRRDILRGLAGLGVAEVAGGSTATPDYRTHVECSITELMDDLGNDSSSGVSISHPKGVYLGNPNDYGDSIGGDDPVSEALVEGEVSVDLVYLEEDISQKEFRKRRKAEYRNYVENLDDFFGLDSIRRALRTLTEALEVGTYPAEDEDYTVPDETLEELGAYVEERYQELLEEFDTDVSVDVRRISAEELEEHGYGIDDLIPPFEGRGRGELASFREDFGYEDGTFPVMLSTRDMGYGFDGLSTERQAFIHLPVDIHVREDSLDNWVMGRMLKQYLALHEIGHGVLRLPHNVYPEDIMSFNKTPRTLTWLRGDELEFSEWTQAFTERYITGDDVPEQRAHGLTVEQLTIFLEDMMEFDLVNKTETAEYLPEEGLVRYTWEYGQGDRTELDVELSNFIDDVTMRSYADRNIVNKQSL